MAGNTFNINNHNTTIQNISNLMSDERRKNVTFTFKHSAIKIKAHKCILEAVSPVFRTMFSGNFVENDEVAIDDITPKVFQLLISGIYLKDVLSLAHGSNLSTYADLYYAAEKYDIADIRAISKKFMMEHCHAGSAAWLLVKAKLFNLPDLEAITKNFFQKNTYKVLESFIRYPQIDATFSEFLELEDLAIEREYDLYMALEVAVDNKVLQNYSKSLSKIRFLTMKPKDILACKLLSNDDKVAVIANLEALKYNWISVVLMPSHLSCIINSRKCQTPPHLNIHYFQTGHDAKHFWSMVMLKSEGFVQYLDRYNPPDKTLTDIIEARRDLENNECDLNAAISKIMVEIFDYNYSCPL